MITITIFSVLQLAALLFLAAGSVRMNRLQTLAKNFDWVLKNENFARKNSEPVFWPLIAAGISLYGLIIAGFLSGTPETLMKLKYYGITFAAVALIGLYYYIDKKVAEKIPLKKTRNASFIRRTLSFYVNPRVLNAAISGTVFVIAAITVSWLAGRISYATFLYDLLLAVFIYGSVTLGIILGLREKIPHELDIKPVAIGNIGENYRRFSMNLFLYITNFSSLFILFLLGLQWYGLDIAHDSLRETLYRFTGEEIAAFRPVFSLIQWDIISSIITAAGCVAMVKSKPFNDIVSIRIKPFSNQNQS